MKRPRTRFHEIASNIGPAFRLGTLAGRTSGPKGEGDGLLLCTVG